MGIEAFTPESAVPDKSEKKEGGFTNEDREKLLEVNMETLADLHKLAADNQQRRINGEISGVRTDEEDSHIQKRIVEVEEEIKSLREIA